jgi:spectinomycin phosphotransferase
MVLCHADLHAGNLLLAEKGELYIVDWDAPLFAPQEKDLALVGGCPTWNNPLEVAQFYRGYKGEGPLQVDAAALAYYRCERAITDIAEFCGQLLLTDAGGADREQSYNYCAGLFLPGHEIELALATNSGLVHARRP